MKNNDISQKDASLFGQLISIFSLDDVVENVIDSLKVKYTNMFLSSGLVNHQVIIKEKGSRGS